MNQKAATGKAPASKAVGGKPGSTGPAARKPATPEPASRKPGAPTFPAPAPKNPAMDAATAHTTHNRELQLNINNERFWKARGYDQRPADWKTRSPAAGPKGS